MVAVAGVAAGVLAGSLAVIALAPPASARAATRPPTVVPAYLTQEVPGPHFVVHYTNAGGT